MTKLTAEAVHAIMAKVLYRDDEIIPVKEGERQTLPANAILVEGIIRNFAFQPDRIMASKPEIDALLSELPDEFFKTKGGGWSFLNACVDKHGELWGQHPDMEALICLGIAAGSAAWILKDMAKSFPGGVPYLEIHPGV